MERLCYTRVGAVKRDGSRGTVYRVRAEIAARGRPNLPAENPMLATVINALAVIVGSAIGLLLKKGLSKRFETAIFTAAGITTIVIGISMALKTTHILAFALALILGGLVGTAIKVEDAVLSLGERLKNRFARGDESGNFALGFLNASVLYCSGAMAIIGSFKAGTEGDYSILLTKSILDGTLSVLFASAMGVGVLFSSLSVFVYQGLLTGISIWVKPYVSQLMLAELTGIGGALVLMIGLGLLDIKKLKTGDFVPALLFTVLFVLAMPYVTFL
jgi:uncharacterized membrane protein YqgA involved in biofilm formation